LRDVDDVQSVCGLACEANVRTAEDE